MREEQDDQVELMPDVTWPRHGFYHTVDSAISVLSQLGIGPDRLTIRKVGGGWQALRVIEQHPAAGSPLASHTMVELVVEGDGLFYYLPARMREDSREGEIGTRELTTLFDDGVEKAAYYVRQGGLFFDVRPGHHAGCARWIRLFGHDPGEWPRDVWYQLAILLPCLRYLAGGEAGLRLALRVLLGIEVDSLNWHPRRTMLPEDDRSTLSLRASRLGVDLILGDGIDDEAAMEITLGPVSLAEYRHFQTDDGQQRLNQVMRLVAPYHWAYEIKWLVGDAERAPRLGYELENAVLGVNTHLGEC